MPGIESSQLDRPAVRAGLAVVIVAAAFLPRQIFMVRFGIELQPFITFYPAVMIAAMLCGFRAGLLATALSAFLVDYWMFPPIGRLAITNASQAISLAIFICMGVFMSAVAGRYRRYQRRSAAFEREQALRETHQSLQEISGRQQALFANMDEGFAAGEMLYDDSGAPCDYRLLEVNHAYEKQTGLKAGMVVGKTVLEVFPDMERSWIEKFGEVAATGVAARFEGFSHNTGKHYETFAYSPSRGKFSLLIRDITERKLAERKLSESEQRLRLFFENAPAALAMFDDRMRYLYASRRWMADYGLGERDLRGMSHYDVFPEVPEAWKGAHRRGLAGEVVKQEGECFERADGSKQWLRWEIRPWHDIAGKVGGIVISTEDISEQKEAEERLLLAASVFSDTSEGIMITASDGTILDVNAAFVRTTGYSRDEVLGRNPRFLSSGRHDKDFYDEMWRALIETGQWSGEIWNRRKNGEIFAAVETITTVPTADGGVLHYVSLFHDITRLKDNERQLEKMAFYDMLTGLPNRVLLADRLRQAMLQARRRQKVLAVALLDLDGFKAVNDGHGHEAGDQFLAALANRMKNALRVGDTLARLGGDEFVAMLPDLDSVAASEPVLARLLDTAAGPVQVGEASLRLSASVGVTFYPQPEDLDPDQLMRQADQAMYQAKLAGRNRLHFFDSAHDQSSSTRYETLNRIRQGLAANEFVLYYQPKVNMRTGQVVGAEALIRWQRPERGLLLPEAFLPVVEDHPLAVDIGEWVIDSALAQMEAWQASGFDIPVSVNVGALQLQKDSFVGTLRMLLAAHPLIQPFQLELEVLETSALQDVATVSEVFDACRKIGVLFALDDFGTGYSSLAYLKHLPANVLKIDQSFVREILNEPKNRAIMKAILGLALAFRLEVIAEGVETVEHGVLLLQLGCELGQGYGIAHPMQACDLPVWSAAWRPDERWANVPPMARA